MGKEVHILKHRTIYFELERFKFSKTVRDHKVLFYRNEETLTVFPPEIIERVVAQDYDKKFIENILMNDTFIKEPFASFIDEIRADFLSLIRGDVLDSILEFESIERMSGEEVYSKYPIGLYTQQGDVILYKGKDDSDYEIESEENTPRITLDQYPIALEVLEKNGAVYEDEKEREFIRKSFLEMLIRIKSNIYYELLSYKFNINSSAKIDVNFLKMGNASFGNDASRYHIEMIPNEINSIIDALHFRNNIKLLPALLS